MFLRNCTIIKLQGTSPGCNRRLYCVAGLFFDIYYVKMREPNKPFQIQFLSCSQNHPLTLATPELQANRSIPRSTNCLVCLKKDLSWSEIYCLSNHTSFSKVLYRLSLVLTKVEGKTLSSKTNCLSLG